MSQADPLKPTATTPNLGDFFALLDGRKTYTCAAIYALGVFFVQAGFITQTQFDTFQSVVFPLVIVCIRQAIAKVNKSIVTPT